MKPAPVLLLAIKPQMLEAVAPTLSLGVDGRFNPCRRRNRSTVPPSRRGVAYVRVMPNMPAAIRKGASAVFAPALDAERRAQVESLVGPLGAVEWVDNEDLFHAITGLSGSGPAFVFRFIDAMAAAGEREGAVARCHDAACAGDCCRFGPPRFGHGQGTA